MAGERPVTRGTRFLAAICACCPLCAIRRRWPRNGFSRALSRVEKGCPFCRAASRVRAARR